MTRPIGNLRLDLSRVGQWPPRFPTWLDGFAAAGIALAIALCLYTSWPLDLHVPFFMSGDATSAQYIFKTILEHGSYLRNPDVGAPFGASMYDYPIPEPTHTLMIRLIGVFTTDVFLAFNVFYLLSFASSAFAACWAFKRNGIDRLPAIAGAIAFAILPYHFFRLAHIFLASYFAIPIFGHYALQLAMYRAPHVPGNPRANWGALLLIAIAAGSGVYYAFFGLLFMALATVFGALQSKNTAILRTAAMYVATIIVVVVVSLLPNALYHLSEGANPLVANRDPNEAEILGLRITQLLFPTPGHRLPIFNAFMAAYRQTVPLVNENMTAALGVLGSIGFLSALVAFFSGETRRYRELWVAGALCTAAVLYASFGGFGAIAARLAIPEIRGLNRISVFIAFFSLFAFLSFARRMLGSNPRASANVAMALAITAIAWTDQIPANALVKPDKAGYQSQQAFFRRLQTSVPRDTAFFEMPYEYFPESPHSPSYYMLEPYVLTQGLRWSFGDMHGRPSDVWNEQASNLKGNELAGALSHAGFGAIYIDRRGYADKGVAIEEQLKAQFGPPIAEDVALGRAVYRVPPASSDTPPFIAVSPGRNWFSWEPGAHQGDQVVWSKGSADLVVGNPTAAGVPLVIQFRLATLAPRKVTLSYKNQVLSVQNLQPGDPTLVRAMFVADAGVSRLSLTTDASAARAGNDPRSLAFRLEDLAYGPNATRF